MKPDEARSAILGGTAPDDLWVDGDLSFSSYERKSSSPPLTHLPNHLHVRGLNLYSCGDLRALPKRLTCEHLSISHSGLTWLPKDLQVSHSLSLYDCYYLKTLPYGLKTRQIALHLCHHITRLPEAIQVTDSLAVTECENLEYLPSQLRLRTLDVSGSPKIVALPSDLKVSKKISAKGCIHLEEVPPLSTDVLDLQGCVSLFELPDGLQVCDLNVSGCTSLQRWPSAGFPKLRRLNMRGCTRIGWLPPGLRQVDELDLRECESLQALPDRLRVTGYLDISGLHWSGLPLSSHGFRLRWNGVAISGQALFHPESIMVEDILAEENVEVRRIMLERMGYQRFFQTAQAELRSQDTDPGGMRQLLVVPLPGDEQLVCLLVQDPSTSRQYLIRVPPWMKDCHQAAAWIAGFDNSDDYQPVVET
jgi:hypothetical protein